MRWVSRRGKKVRAGRRLRFEALENRWTMAAGFGEFIDPNPSDDDGFGDHIYPLQTGNVVITSPRDDGGGVDAGAVYLFNGKSGKLISRLVGSHDGDSIGSAGIVPLPSNHFLVLSPKWNNGDVSDAGAVTFVNGTAGLSGTVTADNSLVGTTASDQVGSDGVKVLTNGNYLVLSTKWDNGSIVDAGAVTFADGLNGIFGAVSESNSLVGTSPNDRVGSGNAAPFGSPSALLNGNYIVVSSGWDNGSVKDAGAVTFGNGLTGIRGAVSAANSLVGSSNSDFLGGGPYGRVVPLTNGNYVVDSPSWDNGGVADAGAATFGDGQTGISGVVTASNSLIGSRAYDRIGSGNQRGFGGVAALTNGNYVVSSPTWGNGTDSFVGAVTFGDGTRGVNGLIDASNSLVGTKSQTYVGLGGVTALANGNYVVASNLWSDANAQFGSAATFGNGTTGVSGPVTPENSLVGSPFIISASMTVNALTDGNYVVAMPDWQNGTVRFAGAVAFGDGTHGIAGAVSAGNSLVGTTINDRVGSGGIQALPNGNYVVYSPDWGLPGLGNLGAVTFASGTAGISGTISANNSLIGSTPGDAVGSYEKPNSFNSLVNDNYVVGSPGWDNGDVTDVGAITFGSVLTGIHGVVSSSNSLVGSTGGDNVGSRGAVSLANGNFVVLTPTWDRGDVRDAGAATWGNSGNLPTGVITSENSLVGISPDDLVGDYGVLALSTGNFVIGSGHFDNDGLVNAGAVTFGSGSVGVSGEISGLNSLLGSQQLGPVGGLFADDVNGNFYVQVGPRVFIVSQTDGFTHRWHFANQPQDVNQDGTVAADDVIAIINYINADKPREVGADAAVGGPWGFLDVTGDNYVAADDVIAVINYINAHPGAAEGETGSEVVQSVASTSLPVARDPNEALLVMLAADVAESGQRRR